MSNRIHILTQDIANQIAAGEVVERPASIVKELVENAIDAGATDVRVEISRGGAESIVITDNGSGIEHEDVALVFERHATSKIKRLDDLYHIGSFGFRGEAMASIASVAHVELLTRRPEDLSGTRAIVEASVISDISPAGCPAGTRISVTNLFANVPARRKFLKTEATEQAACLDTLARLALGHPEVRLTLLASGREIFQTPQAPDSASRVAMVLGEDFRQQSRSVSVNTDTVSVYGWVSIPAYTRSNSKSIYLFVNSRFVRDTSLTHAVLAAYRQVIEPRRYPAAVLFLDMPGEDVDINVHPAKLEVRFKNARGVYDAVARAVATALMAPQGQPQGMSYRLEPKPVGRTGSGFWRPSGLDRRDSADRGGYSLANFRQAVSDDLFTRAQAPQVSHPDAVYENAVSRITFAGCSYLGAFADTYLVFADQQGLMLIDQHAAHERIVLERLKASGGRSESQVLLVPEVVSLPAAHIARFREAMDWLSDIGVELDEFGLDTVAVKAVPAALGHVSPADIVADLADQLADGTGALSLDDRKDKILAALACRAAVKAHAPLSSREVEALCRDLETTAYNATCPHGRPISVRFSVYEIERLFKRK